MAVTLTGTGGLFTRIGQLGGLLNALNTYRGSSLDTDINNLLAQYQSANQEIVDDIHQARDSHKTSGNTFANILKSKALTTLIEQVNDDVVLTSKTKQAAMEELISQMSSSSDDVDASTVSASVAAAAGNTGNAQIIASTVRSDGKQNEYVFAEVMELKITSDAQTSIRGATQSQEPYTVRGEQDDKTGNNTLHPDWPYRSGSTKSGQLVDAAQNNSTTGNVLNNSDFEDFTTTNNPDSWSEDVGTVGTQIFEGGSSDDYKGSNCLKFTGDSSVLTAISQQFNTTSSAGSTVELQPKTVYGVNCFIKVSATPTAGELKLELIDSGGTVINDDESTGNAITVDLTASTTSYAAHNGFFRTPSVLPSDGVIKFRIRFSTAIDNAKDMFLDHLAMTPAVETYQGGPYVAAFSGSTESVIDDQWNITIANNYAGEFQELFDKFYDMKSMGLILPSDTGGTETIADTLIA